jgi:hypothetical protein
MMFVAVAATWARGHGVIIARQIALPKSVMLASRLERSASGTATAAQKANREAPPNTSIALDQPRRQQPAKVFLVTTAKSRPGTRTRTTAKIRNEPYVADVTERP